MSSLQFSVPCRLAFLAQSSLSSSAFPRICRRTLAFPCCCDNTGSPVRPIAAHTPTTTKKSRARRQPSSHTPLCTLKLASIFRRLRMSSLLYNRIAPPHTATGAQVPRAAQGNIISWKLFSSHLTIFCLWSYFHRALEDRFSIPNYPFEHPWAVHLVEDRAPISEFISAFILSVCVRISCVWQARAESCSAIDIWQRRGFRWVLK